MNEHNSYISHSRGVNCLEAYDLIRSVDDASNNLAPCHGLLQAMDGQSSGVEENPRPVSERDQDGAFPSEIRLLWLLELALVS